MLVRRTGQRVTSTPAKPLNLNPPARWATRSPVSSTNSSTPVTINGAPSGTISIVTSLATSQASRRSTRPPAATSINLRDNSAATVGQQHQCSHRFGDTIGLGNSTTPSLGGFLNNLAGRHHPQRQHQRHRQRRRHRQFQLPRPAPSPPPRSPAWAQPAGVTYSGIATLNIDLGLGGDTFTITQTAASPSNAVVNAGARGNNTITR